MQDIPPSKPSMIEALLAAPAITPILAVPLVGILPDVYTAWWDLIIFLPFVAIISLVWGYLGMIFVCAPILALLRRAKKLDAIRLCFYTTLLGGTVWTYLGAYSELPDLARAFTVGAGCSFGVCAFFCLLSGISIRPR
jgi:hypothetical protein